VERSSGSVFDSVDGESHGTCTPRCPGRRTHYHLWRLRLRWGPWSPYLTQRALSALGAPGRTFLPHRDEGYGLSSSAVHRFSCSGTDLLLTVDNGINARAAVGLAQRLGIEVVVIDHHRIQEQAETTAVWSDAFCGAGLAAMFAWALALKAGWNDTKVERMLSGCSQYAAIASIADCVPLLDGTRTLTRLGLAELSRSRHRGLQELLKASCTDPPRPDSRDVAFGVAPRINAAGRMAHPDEALVVFEAALDEEVARKSVDRLNHLNLERRRTVKLHFEEIVESVGANIPAGLVIYCEKSPKDCRPLGEQMCREIFGSQHCARPVDNSRSSSWIRKKRRRRRPNRKFAATG